MIEPHGISNDVRGEPVAFIQRCGSTHSPIVAKLLLICQYRRTGPVQLEPMRSFRMLAFRHLLHHRSIPMYPAILRPAPRKRWTSRHRQGDLMYVLR
jgi:hypothetical protein